jgi:hypothetical protein
VAFQPFPARRFRNASRMLDAVLLVCAGILAYLSWATFREQV